MKDNIESLDAWKETHKEDFKIYHAGSAPAMETAGAKTIFKRSVEKDAVHYSKYYGDGDSMGYAEVRYTYPDMKVKKL